MWNIGFNSHPSIYGLCRVTLQLFSSPARSLIFSPPLLEFLSHYRNKPGLAHWRMSEHVEQSTGAPEDMSTWPTADHSCISQHSRD